MGITKIYQGDQQALCIQDFQIFYEQYKEDLLGGSFGPQISAQNSFTVNKTTMNEKLSMTGLIKVRFLHKKEKHQQTKTFKLSVNQATLNIFSISKLL